MRTGPEVSVAVAQDPGKRYRIRLKFLIGTRLTTDETSLLANFQGREVALISATDNEPLNEAWWLVLSAGSFAKETEARQYGEELRCAIQLAGLCTFVGVDGRSVDDERPQGGFSPEGEQWLRELRDLPPEQLLLPDVHGLSVVPDNQEICFMSLSATGSVTHDPQEFIRSIEEAAARGVPDNVMRAIRVLNHAQINENPIAKVVLAISSIEALAAVNTGWSESQMDMVKQAQNWVTSKFGDGDEAREVGDAIQKVRVQSVRQQAKRLLEENGLMEYWNGWDQMYRHRSRLFHGGASGDEWDAAQLGQDAIRICGKIVLSIAKRAGAVLPKAAFTHFGVGRE